MANYDDALTAAQKRAMRTGRSFFPAANAINATPQGQIIQRSGAGNTGYGIGNGAIPPDQNPAYQAALSRGRVNRNDLTTVYTPSGGTIMVPNKSLGGALAAIKGSTIQPKTAYATDYAKGYGAPTPTIQGGYQIAGGVANPIENLTPQQRVTGGAGSTLDYFRTNPSLNVAANVLSGFGNRVASNQQYGANLGAGLPNFSQIGQQLGGLARNIGSFFGGGNLPSVPATANATQPSPTPYATPSPSPTPTPFKTTDARSDLLRDTEGTFYGGGQAPIPTPTPTPVQRLAYGQPRRYSDNFGYNQYA